MFRRETARERALLRLIDRQQQQIGELVNQVLFLSGRTWTPAPADMVEVEQPEGEQPVIVSALDLLPDEWAARPAEED